jgi:hypothetical protein
VVKMSVAGATRLKCSQKFFPKTIQQYALQF